MSRAGLASRSSRAIVATHSTCVPHHQTTISGAASTADFSALVVGSATSMGHDGGAVPELQRPVPLGWRGGHRPAPLPDRPPLAGRDAAAGRSRDPDDAFEGGAQAPLLARL